LIKDRRRSKTLIDWSRFFDIYANEARRPVAGPHPTPAAQPLPLIIPTWSFERYTRTFVIYHEVNDQNF